MHLAAVHMVMDTSSARPLERESWPFFDIANRKRLTLRLEPGEATRAPALWGIDMDLVRASIDNALARAIARNIDGLIERMAAAGRDAAFPYRVEPFSWLRCCPVDGSVHRVEERHNRICLIQEAL